MTATGEVLAPGRQSLDELAATANREHAACLDAGLTMVEHAIRVGEALIEAKRRLGGSPLANVGWKEWVASNFEASYGTAVAYMRLGRHRDAAIGAINLNEALQLCAGRSSRGENHRTDPEFRADVLAMREEGLSLREVSRMTGISVPTISSWTNPESYKRRLQLQRERQRRRAAERKALAAKERQQAIKRALVKEGEAFNEVYVVITRLDSLLGQARKEAQTREKREAINEAHALRDKMMDTLVRALGVS
jgi:hypothetical protein